jgi:uncharacterized membrane protein YccC
MTKKLKRTQASINGSRAAGSKTPAGIQKSSMNALRHGLTSKALVLSNESQDKFDELHQRYVKKFRPTDDVEMDLVDDMTAARWRLQRVWTLQTAAVDLQMDRQEPEIQKNFDQIDEPTRAVVAISHLANNERTLDLLLRYETTYTRMYHRAMKALENLRKQNLRNDPNPPAAAPENTASDPQPGLESVEKTPTPMPTRQESQYNSSDHTPPNQRKPIP